jgi:multidrug efflux pump subunit AcrB
VGQFQMRIKAPTGTSIESTEKITLQILEMIKKLGNVDTSIAFVGTQPPNYAISTIFLWTAGPQEAVLEVALKEDSKIKLEDFKEALRQLVRRVYSNVEISFEPSNLVDRTMSQGSSTPVEISVSGSNITTDKQYAQVILDALSTLPFLRDLQFSQRLDYPAFEVNVNRKAIGKRGLTASQVGSALVPATSSSRYLVQNYWRDLKSGINYQVQVQVPQQNINSVEDLGNIPIPAMNGDANPLKQYAVINKITKVGEYDRYNSQRLVSVTANLHGMDLGHASQLINEKLKEVSGQKPKGTETHLHGQMPALQEMLSGLEGGLGLAIIIVFLLLAANFESYALAFSILSAVPAVLVGALSMLLLTGTTLNIESFMGTIMAIGVAVANAILLITFAERYRKESGDSVSAAIEGAKSRLRPILMTSGAMLVGMLPMASGLGEGGEQTAPLGRAVLGGVIGSTLATLILLPLVFAWIQNRRSVVGASLDPDDPHSRYFEKETT